MTDSVEKLPTVDMPSRRHRWAEPFTVTDAAPSGCQETHRICELCGVIKITVHPPHGLPYRMWQYLDGVRADGLTPMCGAGD